MASDSTSLANLLTLFPDLHKELDIVHKDVVGKVARPGFQSLKERVLIAEAFFNGKPNLVEGDRRELVTMFKAAGDSKKLKARLKDWETSTGWSTSLPSVLKSLFVSKEQTSKVVNEAVKRSKDMKDWEFLAALPEILSKEPLLEQLTQDAIMEAHVYFQEFMKEHLNKLYSRACDIKRQTMYHQVELVAKEQDRNRKMLLRSVWFDAMRLVQEGSMYIFPLSMDAPGLIKMCVLGPKPQCLSTVLRR